jgi:hypothetical protein
MLALSIAVLRSAERDWSLGLAYLHGLQPVLTLGLLVRARFGLEAASSRPLLP